MHGDTFLHKEVTTRKVTANTPTPPLLLVTPGCSWASVSCRLSTEGGPSFTRHRQLLAEESGALKPSGRAEVPWRISGDTLGRREFVLLARDTLTRVGETTRRDCLVWPELL